MTDSSGIELENMFIEPAGELDAMSEQEKQEVSDNLVNFLHRYQNLFGEAHLKIDVKRHKEKMQEKPKIYCKINLTTDKGRWNASEHGWGFERAVHNALGDVETQITKKFGKMRTKSKVRKRDKDAYEVTQ